MGTVIGSIACLVCALTGVGAISVVNRGAVCSVGSVGSTIRASTVGSSIDALSGIDGRVAASSIGGVGSSSVGSVGSSTIGGCGIGASSIGGVCAVGSTVGSSAICTGSIS